jgi:hypothetical protein
MQFSSEWRNRLRNCSTEFSPRIDFALTFLALFVSRQKGHKLIDHPVGETIRYHIRTGKHDFTLYDWQQYLDFADKQFGRNGKN